MIGRGVAERLSVGHPGSCITMKSHTPPKQAVADAVASLQDWVLDRLAGLVAFPSVLGAELPAQERIAGIYEELGFAAKLLPVEIDRLKALPGFSPVDWDYGNRPNAVGLHEVEDPAGRSLVINGHIDVTSHEPLKLWSRDPFRLHVEREGATLWAYGRGAGDMKGGTMCALWALQALRAMGLEPASRVVLQSPIEEECTGNGTLALLADGYTGDAALIPEPFGETVLCSQVGVMWFQVRVLGRTTHVLGAGRGVNAIEKSWLIIQALRRLERETNRPDRIPAAYRHYEHPINLNVGTIRGGDWASTVAGECVTRFRIGLFPGESLAELRVRIEQCVAEAAVADPWLQAFPPSVEYVGFQADGCSFDDKGEFGGALGAVHRLWRGTRPAPLHLTATTDARFFNLHYGIPATCYGPKAENIHGVDERVNVDSMRNVAEVITSLIAEWCGVRKRR